MGNSLSEVNASVITKGKKGWRRLFAFLGPAYLVSVGYMDPGNWATDIAGGSEFGYKLIWVLLLSNLMALLLQTLSVRLGIVGGFDLAQASRKRYPGWANIPLFILAQVAIIACDLAEIIGMAIGLQLLFGLPVLWGIIITILDTFLLLFLLNKGMKMMESFILSMVSIVGLSFLVEMFIVEPSIKEVVKGLEPSVLSGNALYIAIGIIGATVMPHNLYLHSSLVQTRKIERTRKGIKESLKFNLIDTTVALNIAFLVNASILILAATAFYKNGFHQVAEINDAYLLLENIFGSLAPSLFAIALIAAGQSSTVTGTLAGQIVMEGHINLRIQPWLRRLLTRLLAIIPAFFTILYFGEGSLGELLILSQVVLSLQLGFAVIPLIHFTSDKKLMGEFAIKTWMKILSWLCALIIVVLNLKLVIEEITLWYAQTDSKWLVYTLAIPLAIAILLLLIYISVHPLLKKQTDNVAAIPHGTGADIEELEQLSYKKIGIPVDFSDKDNTTIRNALIQGGKEADYHLIHVVETAGARYHGDSVLDHETKSDMDSLEKYKDRLIEMGYKAHSHVGFGSRSSAIGNLAKELGLDLLVVGAHGHKVFKDAIFGGTVDALRHKVDIPVLIIK